jgi:HSP20 family protein
MTMMTRYDPAANMVSLREAMDQLFRDSFVTPFGRLAQTTANMPVDVYETGDAFVVKAFMPGLTADDLQINVQEQIVTIHGEPKAENPEGMRPLLQERWIGAFTRTFTLPVSVEPDKVEAELMNGVLNVTLPKSEASKPRKIQVRSS